jgi:molybdopterin synthase catalytic subunit
MFLEHYPGMTEKALAKIVLEAEQRWPLLKVEVLHRIGALQPGEPIVFVGVASAHRQAAFQACDFVRGRAGSRGARVMRTLRGVGRRPAGKAGSCNGTVPRIG